MATSAASPAASPAQVSAKDKISYYHDEQDKVRDHWGIASTIPPEASAIQVTPTSFVSVTKWTRTQSNKLLFDAGFAVYDQEYQENYQPDVLRQRGAARTRSATTATGKIANAWNNPADHFSKLFTEQFAANYVTGAHSLRGGIVISQAQWRLAQQYTLRRAAGHLQRRRAGLGRRCKISDRPQERDRARHRPVRAGQVDDRPRHDQPRPPLRPVHRRDPGRRRCRPAPSTRRSPIRSARTARTT